MPDMPIKAVLFDLDETLIDDAAAVDATFRVACGPIADRTGLPLEHCVLTARAVCDRLYEAIPDFSVWDGIGLASWEVLSVFDTARDAPSLGPLHRAAPEFRRQTWLETLRALDVEDIALAARLSDRFLEARRRSHHLFPEARSVLDTLARRLPLVLVTNGASSLQREKIDAVGIAPYFRSIVISGEIGVGKPAPEIFRHCWEQVGVPPNEAVVVGDSIGRDVAGAAGAGMPAIWLDRLGSADTAPSYPLLARIVSLDELSSVVLE